MIPVSFDTNGTPWVTGQDKTFRVELNLDPVEFDAGRVVTNGVILEGEYIIKSEEINVIELIEMHKRGIKR